MINYVKRMFNAFPFEGAKLIEGEEGRYYIAAITLTYTLSDSIEKLNALAEMKAEDAAKKTFAEPCIKFEMLSNIIDSVKNKITYLFICEPLSEFVINTYKKQPFDGAKIISAPNNSYFISVVSLDTSKYTSQSMMDRVALIKAKQQANTLFNGSVIISDIIIYTEEKAGKSFSNELIKEQSMGFVEGLESLLKFINNENRVYIFYRELGNH